MLGARSPSDGLRLGSSAERSWCRPWIHRRFRSLLPTLALVVSVAPLRAQLDTTVVRIIGVVVDPMRQPIEGAEVRVMVGGAAVLTGPNGAFRLVTPRTKEVLVQIRRPGYRAQLLRFDNEWAGTVVLEPGTYELPEVRVMARYAKPAAYAATSKFDDYFKRRRLGLGQFISREDIDRRGPLEVAQMLEGKPGIKVNFDPYGAGTAVSFARCREWPPKINVYLDGRKLLPPLRDSDGTDPRSRVVRHPVGDMLDRIAVADVELIEIFRGPSELPPEFNDGNCGAISIWTRQGAR